MGLILCMHWINKIRSCTHGGRSILSSSNAVGIWYSNTGNPILNESYVWLLLSNSTYDLETPNSRNDREV